MASRAGTRVAALVAAGALLIGAAGCGDDDGGSGTATMPTATEIATATAPTTTTPPATVTTPPATATTPPTATTSPEDEPGGAGDEEASVVPAIITFGDVGPRPDRVEVPAFFTIRLTGVANDGKDHEIVFQGETIAIAAGETASKDFPGLKTGSYPVEIDGIEGAAQIVAGAEAGP